MKLNKTRNNRIDKMIRNTVESSLCDDIYNGDLITVADIKSDITQVEFNRLSGTKQFLLTRQYPELIKKFDLIRK